ncbi:MAG: DUF3576 domain-containing protein [Geminicoccaceae bacterium]
MRALVFRALSLAALGVLVSACGTGDPDRQVSVEPAEEYQTEQKWKIREQYGTIHGNDGFDISGWMRGDRNNEAAAGAGGGVGVNSFLWYASLETVDFMPLASTDPFGGVIITDWYVPPESPNERFKLNVYIRDTVLRADGLRVAAFRQVREGDTWVDAPVAEQTEIDLENAILSRARDLKIASAG